MCASSFLTASAPEALLHVPYICSPMSRCQPERDLKLRRLLVVRDFREKERERDRETENEGGREGERDSPGERKRERESEREASKAK